MVIDPTIKKGYKQTEIGLLPEDWTVKTFKDICWVNQGLQIAIEKRLDNPTAKSKKYITIQCLNNGKETEYIDDYSSSVCCNNNDILMTRTGNTGIVISGVEGVFHNNFFKINFDKNQIEKDYLLYYLRDNKTKKIILEKAGTSTIPDLNHNDFYSIRIPLPSSKFEQTAITSVLSDVDALIQSLDKLIAKKKAIKKGTMQQLLTGKKRLSGFSGEWEVKKFKDKGITRLITCGIAATPQYKNENIGIPFLSSTNIKSGKIKWDNFKYISRDLHKKLYKNNPPMKGDILYSRVGTIGEAAIIDVNFEFSIYVSLTLIKPGILLYNEFLKQSLNSDAYKTLAKNTVLMGGGVGNLNVNVVREFPITFPSLKEQIAIATILSDMDEEIKQIEQRRDKYKMIKQGMMQQLLTGKIRLL